jgi:hypothetical protein
MEKPDSTLNGVRVMILAATLVTAVVHLFLGAKSPDILGILFILNGLGYLGLLGMFLVPIDFLKPYHEIVRWVLAGFAALTIVLWVILNGKPDGIGLITKLAEVLLIVGLVVDRGKR